MDRDVWGYLKKRDMKGLYPHDKIQVVVDRRTQQNWFLDDEDFPGDMEERAYWVRLKRTTATDQVQREKISFKASGDVDPAAAAALTPKKSGDQKFWDLVAATPGSGGAGCNHGFMNGRLAKISKLRKAS